MSKKKKVSKSLVEGVDKVFLWLESKKFIWRTPAFQKDFQKDYPLLATLQDNYPDIQRECKALLKIKDSLMDVSAMAGDHTKGGIHAVKWKTFMFKSGFMVKNSRALCPVTYDTIKNIPHVSSAFFSILDPNQYIKAHRGYYQGIMRYHLGVIIPKNNANSKCWVRVHDDIGDNLKYDKSTIVKGEKYYWKNGDGIIFNDNYLHDAANESDQVRVILWLDLKRKMPPFFNAINSFFLFIAHVSPVLGKIKKRAEDYSAYLLKISKNKSEPADATT
ncbi:MAG: aspartyl/asparaginyl beta-hydroxylase domain-containing protein [Imperialibacter sp.]|uniref:aspartyl/asparaginyl beta-hydroxylase domain-containing protein n=1 Tax=Imperialibacter sp. TaxID=2038411 RepID=UPI0032ECAAE2